MGACLSSSIDKSDCAFVVSIEGELIEYPTPIFVSEVLQPSSFVCNSDSLYFDHPIPALDQEHQLEAGQIYFILQKPMLHRRLGTSEMAALALKASDALDSHYQKTKKNKARISPLETSVVAQEEDQNNLYNRQQKQNSGLRVSRSGSIRQYSSKKARLAVRSFSIRLSTIYENEGCDDLRIN